MNDVIEEFEHGPCTCEIVLDMSPIDPREDFEPATCIWAAHRSSSLGDSGQPNEFMSQAPSMQQVVDYVKENMGTEVVSIRPLYMYKHSGIALSTSPFSCPWDSGQIGYVFLTRESIDRLGIPETNYFSVLDSEVEEYSAYLNGNVYGYVVNDDEGEQVDSCFGYFSIKDAKEEAKAVADLEIQHRRRTRFERLKELIRNRVPLAIRQQQLGGRYTCTT